MPVLSLTDVVIKSIKAPDKGQVTYVDRSLSGFGVRVSAHGAKVFVVVHGKNRARTTIGRYPVVSLQDARKKARTILAAQTLRKHELPTVRFETAVETFLSTHTVNNKPRTAASTRRLLRKHFLPPLRRENLQDITTDKIAALIDRLLPTPGEANHAFAAARLFFRWATRRRYLMHSPMEGMQLPSRVRSRDRVLTNSELAHVSRTAAAIGHPFGTIVQLLILTGQRRGEIASLRWQDVDQNGRTITLPREIVKNNRPHTFPLGEMAIEILGSLPRTEGYLHPARGSDGPFSGYSKAKIAFDKRCPIAPWTLHDLRRTFATGLASLGIPVHVTEKLLNHVSGSMGGIVAIYQRHAYMDEMRAAIKVWEAHLNLLITDPCI